MTVSPTSGWLDSAALLAPSGPARTRTSLCSNNRALLPPGRCDARHHATAPELTSTRPSMACPIEDCGPGLCAAGLHARFVHRVHQHAHVLRVHFRRDAVAEVEDVAGMRAEVVEHASGFAADRFG